MAKRESTRPQGALIMFAGGAVLASSWPSASPSGRSNQESGRHTDRRLGSGDASDGTRSRGTAAQTAAVSTVGKNDPAGQEDATGARARAIKQGSQPRQLGNQQRQQIKAVIARQQDAPGIERRLSR